MYVTVEDISGGCYITLVVAHAIRSSQSLTLSTHANNVDQWKEIGFLSFPRQMTVWFQVFQNISDKDICRNFHPLHIVFLPLTISYDRLFDPISVMLPSYLMITFKSSNTWKKRRCQISSSTSKPNLRPRALFPGNLWILQCLRMYLHPTFKWFRRQYGIFCPVNCAKGKSNIHILKYHSHPHCIFG